MPSHSKRPFSGPSLTVISINIEGLTKEKATLLADISKENCCDVLCVQETHVHGKKPPIWINGMRLVAEIAHSKHGSAVCVQNNVEVVTAEVSTETDMEVITIELEHCTVTSVYNPPGKAFSFRNPLNLTSKPTEIILGDFNSHSSQWGYAESDQNGKLVEQWAANAGMSLIHDAKLPASSQSKRWQRGYNPDLIFVSGQINNQCEKKVLQPIPKSQHRPVMLQTYAAIKPVIVPFRRRFNFKKANWREFKTQLDDQIASLEPDPANYDKFIKIVQEISRKTIPRGCRRKYIPGMNKEAETKLAKYEESYEENPFSGGRTGENTGREKMQTMVRTGGEFGP